MSTPSENPEAFALAENARTIRTASFSWWPNTTARSTGVLKNALDQAIKSGDGSRFHCIGLRRAGAAGPH